MQGAQSVVIAFLQGLARDAAGSQEEPHRIDTHAAHIFLVGDRAIKIKRAVHYDYLDFSLLEQRHKAIEREYEINKPNAPGIYEAVIPVTRSYAGDLRLGGDGEIVEWALRMRRFEQSDLLSHICAHEGLSTPLIKALAAAVLKSHRSTAPRSRHDQVAQYRHIIDQICSTLARVPAFAEQARTLGELARSRLQDAADHLAERTARGCVRRCHGDLHLENVVLWQGRPTLFDAIEFDEGIATIDTLYDLAFLLMDLDVRGARAAANAVLNHYLWLSGAESEIAGLGAMPLFLALRAGIRAMVAAQRGQLASEAGAASPPSDTHAQADRYLDAAIGFLQPPPPQLIAVGGFSGSGKSTLAAGLAPLLGAAPGALHLRSDLERKSLFGASETQRLDEHAYREEASARVYAIMQRKAAIALGARHTVIVDAVFSKPEERDAIEAVARSAGVQFRGLWLDVGPKTMSERIAGRVGDASDATPEVLLAQLGRGTGAISWSPVPAGGSREHTLALARNSLSL